MIFVDLTRIMYILKKLKNNKMTQEETKELLPIMQAYTEGKTIECSHDGKSWSKIDFPSWIPNMHYRIKPEPKYRPFNNQRECWNEILKHQPFGWIKAPNGDLSCIDKIFDKGVTYDHSSRQFSDYIADNYTFADGTPFGIKI